MPYHMAMMYKITRGFVPTAARLFLSVSLSLALGISLYGQQQFKTSLQSAQKLLESGKDDEAGAALNSLTHEVENARAPLLKKTPPNITDHDRELLRFYNQILAGARNSLGLIAARHEQFEEAARQFTLVKKLQPDFPDVDFNLGLALFSAKHYSEALPPLEYAASRNPSNEKFKKYLGLTLVGAEQYEKALKLLDEARLLDPGDPRIPMALGTALARTNRLDEARQVFEEMLTSQPETAVT